METPDSAAVLKQGRVRLPLVKGLLFKSVLMRLDKSLHQLRLVTFEVEFLLPDVHCSLLLLLGIHRQSVPNTLNRISFEMIAVHFVALVLFPGVENLGAQNIAVNCKSDVVILVSRAHRL